ncbi:hypothetical protein [Salinibacterium sp.]|uniref:hypothetical protein n=1 Tax=Salinibacterium sp. TaxID=1915057 RepID=UPI00286CD258|nr:hypothetical protein [Salinibacterium sp.]
MTTTAPTTPSPTTPSPATATPTDRVLGILALAFGVASIGMGFQPVFAVAGLILGILSLRRESSGRGLAIGGIITSSVTLAGWLLGALAALALVPIFAVAALWA